jgi:5-methylcytosine-specific restriction endonuclease McrA
MKKLLIYYKCMAGGNKYKMSNGEKVTKSFVDRKVREAKKEKLDQQLEEHGYNFCEEPECGRSGGTYLDCSHDVSVDKCQKEGMTELAWDINNITIRCRECHKKHD